MVVVGQDVNVKLSWKNIGNVSHAFWLKVAFVSEATAKTYTTAYKTDSASAGSTDSTSFTWKVPSTAPKGSYKIMGYIGESTAEMNAGRNFDIDQKSNAFSVS